MHLDLTDEETAALTKELHEIVEKDRYPFSPRIRTLRAIRAKLSASASARTPAAEIGDGAEGWAGRWRRCTRIASLGWQPG